MSARDSLAIEHGDTILVPPLGARAVPACVLRVAAPHGMRPGDSVVPATTDSVPLMLRSPGTSWHRLLRYDADGPDGTQTAYQRGDVRCVAAQGWDGGDDGDSTYVPDPWYRLELTCWTAAPDTLAAETLP